MSTSVIAHKIKQGERWDTVAYAYYGEVGEMGRLIDANPHLALCEQLPAGETLFVPVIAVKNSDQHDLPPWLQE